jgi:hypothetical protein
MLTLGGASVTESNGIRDFTPEQKPPIRFRLYGDVLEAAPELPAGTLLDFIGLADQFQGADEATSVSKLGLITDLFDKVLLPKSAEVFRERMRDLERPIGINTVAELLPWLLDQYTGRPLVPSAPSSGGSGNAGSSSTDEQPSQVSIPVASPPTGS